MNINTFLEIGMDNQYFLITAYELEILREIRAQKIVEHYQRVLQYWENNPLRKKL